MLFKNVTRSTCKIIQIFIVLSSHKIEDNCSVLIQNDNFTIVKGHFIKSFLLEIDNKMF